MARHRYSKFFPVLFLGTDLMCLNLSFTFANLIRFGEVIYLGDNYGLLLLFINLVWIIVFFLSNLHVSNRDSPILDVVNRVLLALVFNLSLTFTFWVVTSSYHYSREHLFYTYLFLSFLVIFWRLIFYYLIRVYRRRGYNFRNVLIVGYGESAQHMVHYMNHNPSLGYRFLGFLDNKEHDKSKKILGSVKDLNRICSEFEVDIIFCCLPKLYDDEVKSVIDYAENNLIKIKVISRFSTLINRNLSINKYGDIPIIDVGNIPLDRIFNRFVKRAFDLVFSSIVILLMVSWLIPIIGLLIKLESRGPIFFRQYRNGRDNKKFLIFKFRTMVVHSDSNVAQAKQKDTRITKIGSFLRKTSLDELPQFFNVFTGQMSVVGPRPHAVPHNEEYQKKIDRFIQRHAVKPGITGLAQAKGYRGETAHFSAMYGRVKLDRFYVKNWSLLLDLKIIILTIVSIVRGQETAY